MNKGLALVVVGSVVVTCLTITGCAIGRASYDMESSKAKYKNCLETYPNDDSKCEGLRKMFEVDKEHMETIRGNKTNVEVEIEK